MNDRNDQRLRELLFAYEELEETERAEVDAWLDENPGEAAAFRRLRELETRAAEEIPDPGPLPGADCEGEQASLRALEAKLGLRSSRTPRPRRPVFWAAPVAAAAILLLLFAPWGPPGLEVTDLQVVALQGPDGARAPESGSGFHSGQVIALRFELPRDAWVLVYHVSPGGEIALVVPESADAPVPLIPRGSVELPGEHGSAEWVLGIDVGMETFVVAARADAPLVPVALDFAPPDPESAVASLRSRLAGQAAAVEVIGIRHLR